MRTKEKSFDCVEMKRKGALAVYEAIKDMSPEEQLAYWKQKTVELKQRQAELREKFKTHGVNKDKNA